MKKHGVRSKTQKNSQQKLKKKLGLDVETAAITLLTPPVSCF